MMATIENPALREFITQEQNKRDEEHKLNAFQLLALYQICRGENVTIDGEILTSMEKEGLINLIEESNNEKKWQMNNSYQLILKNLLDTDSANSNNESNNERGIYDTLTPKQQKVVDFCVTPRSAQEILTMLELSDQMKNRNTYINDLIKLGVLKQTKPGKKAKGQQYITQNK